MIKDIEYEVEFKVVSTFLDEDQAIGIVLDRLRTDPIRSLVDISFPLTKSKVEVVRVTRQEIN